MLTPLSQDGDYVVTQGQVVGLFTGLLIFHGVLVGPVPWTCERDEADSVRY
jgi:hypothetical protein